MYAINGVEFYILPSFSKFHQHVFTIFLLSHAELKLVGSCMNASFLASPRVKVDTERNKCSFDGEGRPANTTWTRE